MENVNRERNVADDRVGVLEEDKEELKEQVVRLESEVKNGLKTFNHYKSRVRILGNEP